MLRENAAEDEAADRPPWHWVGFGAVALLVVWLPLAAVAEVVATRAAAPFIGHVDRPAEAAEAVGQLSPAARRHVTLVLIGLPVASLVLAAFAAGFVVGRWGGRAGTAEAALAGALAALLVAGLTCASAGASWTALAALVPAAAAAALGGAVGRKRRPAA